jgi:hypothetical protein
MAITNYTNLQTTIADTLNRDDLTSVIPTFVSLCRVSGEPRHTSLANGVTLKRSTVAGDAYMQVPADWVETLRFNVVGNGTSPIKLIDSTTMADLRAMSTTTSTARLRCTRWRLGSFIYTQRPLQTLTLNCYTTQKCQTLASNATNWLLSYAPDVYLYGSLLHSAPYLQDDARVAVWAQLYSAGVTRLNETSAKAKSSGSNLKLKVRGLG